MTKRYSMAAKPNTFTYNGEEVSGTPSSHWPYEKSLAWLRNKDLPSSSPVYVTIAKLYRVTVDALVQAVQATTPKDLPKGLTPITPNTVYGPLSVQQKQEIWDNHSDVRTSHLAYLYGTNPQNVRLAKQQRFTDRTPGRQPGDKTLTLDPFTPSTRYGPLSLKQQHEIHKYHSHICSLTALANTYKTSIHYVRRAINGDFTAVRPPSREYATLFDAARILGIDVKALIELSPDRQDLLIIHTTLEGNSNDH